MQTVRFIKKARFDEWNPGDYGEFVKNVALMPQNQRNIDVIRLLKDDKLIWAYRDEYVMGYEQLRLF